MAAVSAAGISARHPSGPSRSTREGSRGALLLLALLLPACATYPATLDEYVADAPGIRADGDGYVVTTDWVVRRVGVAQSLGLALAMCQQTQEIDAAPYVESGDVFDLPPAAARHERVVTRAWVEGRFEIEQRLQGELATCAVEAASNLEDE